MNTGDCLYIYRQLADGNGRGNCKPLCIAENCYIQPADAVGKKIAIESCIYIESVSWQVDTPAAPANRAQNLHGAYQPGDNPRQPPEVTGFYSQGLLQLPPISILGIKKGCI